MPPHTQPSCRRAAFDRQLAEQMYQTRLGLAKTVPITVIQRGESNPESGDRSGWGHKLGRTSTSPLPGSVVRGPSPAKPTPSPSPPTRRRYWLCTLDQCRFALNSAAVRRRSAAHLVSGPGGRKYGQAARSRNERRPETVSSQPRPSPLDTAPATHKPVTNNSGPERNQGRFRVFSETASLLPHTYRQN